MTALRVPTMEFIVGEPCNKGNVTILAFVFRRKPFCLTEQS